MAVSHKLASYVHRCLFTLTNAQNPNQIQVRPVIFRYNFSEPLFFGPSSFHILDPCICYTDFYLLRIHAPCVFKNTCYMGFTFHIYTSKPISLGLPCIHVCLKTLLLSFYQWAFFIRNSFHFQRHCIDSNAICFRFSLHNLGNSEPRHK